MIANTFCHIPGIGEATERRLWSSGVLSWDDCFAGTRLPLSQARQQWLKKHLEESRTRLAAGDPGFFARLLPPRLHWRLFAAFRQALAYLDIETTGMSTWDHSITAISLYDGRSLRHYVQGRNLEDFETDVDQYRLLVTYNGKCFDLPFIQWAFRTTLSQVHLDLRFLLKSLGFTGGLKGCEKQLGIDRGELEGVDGIFAVLLWDEYRRTRNEKALETLLAYNAEDTVNLERLMVTAYNLNLQGTPFAASHLLPLPGLPQIPYRSDRETIERIRFLISDPSNS